jgi:hypothetical protein
MVIMIHEVTTLFKDGVAVDWRKTRDGDSEGFAAGMLEGKSVLTNRI